MELSEVQFVLKSYSWPEWQEPESTLIVPKKLPAKIPFQKVDVSTPVFEWAAYDSIFLSCVSDLLRKPPLQLGFLGGRLREVGLVLQSSINVITGENDKSKWGRKGTKIQIHLDLTVRVEKMGLKNFNL